MQINWKSCDSSFISSYAYDSDAEVLYIRFKKDGSTLAYGNVPFSVYEGMDADPRPGNFFRVNIYRAGYTWRRV